MPRGKKNLSLDEQLEQVDNLIVEYTEKLKELKDQKKDLEQQIKNRDIAELYDAVMSSGKTIAEVKEMLAN